MEANTLAPFGEEDCLQDNDGLKKNTIQVNLVDEGMSLQKRVPNPNESNSPFENLLNLCLVLHSQSTFNRDWSSCAC